MGFNSADRKRQLPPPISSDPVIPLPLMHARSSKLRRAAQKEISFLLLNILSYFLSFFFTKQKSEIWKHFSSQMLITSQLVSSTLEHSERLPFNWALGIIILDWAANAFVGALPPPTRQLVKETLPFVFLQHAFWTSSLQKNESVPVLCKDHVSVWVPGAPLRPTN